jgi:hypothetical protein
VRDPNENYALAALTLRRAYHLGGVRGQLPNMGLEAGGTLLALR